MKSYELFVFNVKVKQDPFLCHFEQTFCVYLRINIIISVFGHEYTHVHTG